MKRASLRIAAVLSAAAAVLSGTVVEAAAAPTDSGTGAAGEAVALPELTIAHRIPSTGGIKLWRMPLSEYEDGVGSATPVRTLSGGGWSYDRSRTVTGDFADVTAGDDGTADTVVWHAAGDGSVKVWAVGGGSDTAPRLWMDLHAPWSWSNSRVMAGDVTGDGWDDLVVRHWAGCGAGSCTVNVWVLASDGERLGQPQLWLRQTVGARDTLDSGRQYLGDVDGDGIDDWVTVSPVLTSSAATSGLRIDYRRSTGATFGDSTGYATQTGGGWSYAGSRQLVGDVTGDGLADVVTVHRAGNDRMYVWVHPSDTDGVEQWQTLTTGGWSYSGSRQYLADSDGDGVLDLISLHRAGADAGFLVWRHASVGTAFAAPQQMAFLSNRYGWDFGGSRAGVADLYGVFA